MMNSKTIKAAGKTTMRKRRSRSGERGAALMVVLILMAILTIMSAGVLFMVDTESTMVGNKRSAEKAFYTAEAGIEHVKAVMVGSDIGIHEAICQGLINQGKNCNVICRNLPPTDPQYCPQFSGTPTTTYGGMTFGQKIPFESNAGGNPLSYYEITMTECCANDGSQDVILQSTGTLDANIGGGERKVETKISTQMYPINGAFQICDPNVGSTEFELERVPVANRSTVLNISGTNHNLQGQALPNDPCVPGLAVINPANWTPCANSPSSQQNDIPFPTAKYNNAVPCANVNACGGRTGDAATGVINPSYCNSDRSVCGLVKKDANGVAPIDQYTTDYFTPTGDITNQNIQYGDAATNDYRVVQVQGAGGGGGELELKGNSSFTGAGILVLNIKELEMESDHAQLMQQIFNWTGVVIINCMSEDAATNYACNEFEMELEAGSMQVNGAVSVCSNGASEMEMEVEGPHPACVDTGTCDPNNPPPYEGGSVNFLYSREAVQKSLKLVNSLYSHSWREVH